MPGGGFRGGDESARIGKRAMRGLGDAARTLLQEALPQNVAGTPGPRKALLQIGFVGVVVEAEAQREEWSGEGWWERLKGVGSGNAGPGGAVEGIVPGG